MDRMRRVQTMQHVLAAVILIATAYGHLTDPKHHEVVLPVLEMLAGAALIITAIVEKVRKTHAKVGWLELAGAAMTYVEAIAKLHERHHLSFHILTFVSPTVLLLFGLFDARIKAGLRFEASDDAFFARMRLIRGHRVPWDTIRSYRITPTHLEIARASGNVKRLKLTDLYDRDAASAWIAGQFTKRGIALR
jgi:hypothetical protein